MTSEKSNAQASKLVPYSGDLSHQGTRDKLVSEIAHALDSSFFEGIEGQKATEFLRDVFDVARAAKEKSR